MPTPSTISFSRRRTSGGSRGRALRLVRSKVARAGGSKRKVGYNHAHFNSLNSFGLGSRFSFSYCQVAWQCGSTLTWVPGTSQREVLPLGVLETEHSSMGIVCMEYPKLYSDMRSTFFACVSPTYNVLQSCYTLPGWLWNSGQDWEESGLEASPNR